LFQFSRFSGIVPIVLEGKGIEVRKFIDPKQAEEIANKMSVHLNGLSYEESCYVINTLKKVITQSSFVDTQKAREQVYQIDN
jgi:hypothetical protein